LLNSLQDDFTFLVILWFSLDCFEGPVPFSHIPLPVDDLLLLAWFEIQLLWFHPHLIKLDFLLTILTIRKPSNMIVARFYDQIGDHASNYPNPSTSSFSTKSLISTCISISHMIAISFSISSSALLRTASASADDWTATVSTVTLFKAAIWISLWMVYKVLLEACDSVSQTDLILAQPTQFQPP